MLSQFLQPVIDMLERFAQIMPLPWFAFVGAFIEELIAPIPSPLVMTLAGSLAAAEQAPVTYLVIVALIGAVGKTLGSYFIYIIADKGEDFVLTKLGKFIGITHKEVESIGKHLNKGWRDDIVLFLMRAIPIMPTAPVSIVCGLIKLKMRTYLTSTFFGTFVRNIFYLYLGYTSLGALEQVNEGLDSVENFGYVIILAGVAAIMLWIYKQRQKSGVEAFFDRFMKK